jgi:hypothetical protein
MAFSMSPTSSTVAITGSVSASSTPIPPSGATLIHVSGTTASIGSTAIHTVTAGKTLYIVSCNIAIWGAGGGATCSSLDCDNGAGTYKNLVSVYMTASAAANASNQFPIAVQVAATKTVRVTHSAAQGAAAYNFVGYEV